MGATLLLGEDTWDLVLDVDGNIALATTPYAQAQDAASAIKTFLGECFWDTSIGVPWTEQILGFQVPLDLIKEQLSLAALTVPGVISAQVFITAFTNRAVTGQVQIATISEQTAFANFTSINPQGLG